MYNLDSRLRTDAMHWSRDIHPTDQAPVITAGSNGTRTICLTLQRWGYPGIQNKGVIINGRQESVWEKRMFSRGMQYHRAVIPADHFYEWNASKEKYTFRRKDRNPLFLAGFFDVMQNEERFVILTTTLTLSDIQIRKKISTKSFQHFLFAVHRILRFLTKVFESITP